LYDKLERVILPMFYSRPDAWATVMRFAISLNGSYFNAHRMLSQYVESAYAAVPTRAAVPAVAGAQDPAHQT